MFLHTHPYEPYLFEEATKLIVGTLPPPRFTIRAFKPGDVDFCYGSRDGQLWRILDRIFDLKLLFETTDEAVLQRKTFLRKQQIGICDIVASAEREKIDASDLGMKNIVLRDLVSYLREYTAVDTLLFTGGNSKNGPEYFFRRHLRDHGLKLELLSNDIPRIHQFTLTSGTGNSRLIKTVSLTAPSGSANRAVGSMATYQERKTKDPSYNTFDFRVDQYKQFF
ncbi:uracil-DNA glycosylase family protein [Poritiphilus flavus]|uniref:Uracil-DNA glycosylase family protein n=1 Tax=Poritiphilus flavus TaxID=2697053 RepID=A0A6L9EAW0_9FLAO|nr:uracil-DNA glycosylase family protein [Poritiphilus flavus]NAS11783.1 uracil-DNA glycosylase family protein [Poritiphilus flavus]